MDRSLPRLALVGLAVVVLGVVVVTGATSTSSFGTHNPSWDGTAEFRSMADETASTGIVRNVSAYDRVGTTDRVAANDTLAVVLSPSEPYGTDAAAIERFLDRGGTVLVAEDYRSNANPLLATLGSSVRFDGHPVRDERNYERTPTFVEVSVVGDRPPSRTLDTLVLNRGTTLEAGRATVLARTTMDAYLDVDRDATLDDGELPAQRPVLAVESVGGGRIVTLADPSVFINSMLDYGDNRELATRLAERHDRVLFDVSHSGGVPPLVATVLAIRDSPLLQGAIGATLALALAGRHRLGAAVHRLRRIRGDGPTGVTPALTDPDAVARSVIREHPRWDESRVERIASGAVERPVHERYPADHPDRDQSDRNPE